MINYSAIQKHYPLAYYSMLKFFYTDSNCAADTLTYIDQHRLYSFFDAQGIYCALTPSLLDPESSSIVFGMEFIFKQPYKLQKEPFYVSDHLATRPSAETTMFGIAFQCLENTLNGNLEKILNS